MRDVRTEKYHVTLKYYTYPYNYHIITIDLYVLLTHALYNHITSARFKNI